MALVLAASVSPTTVQLQRFSALVLVPVVQRLLVNNPRDVSYEQALALYREAL